VTTASTASASMILLFTPRQTYVSTFLGGPLAGGLLIKKNFDALGRAAAGRRALGIAIVVAVAVLAGGAFLPDGGSRGRSISMLAVIVYSGIAALVVQHFQQSKAAIEQSPVYGFQPLKRTVLPVLGSILVTAVVVVAAVGAAYLFLPGTRDGKIIKVREITGVVERMESDRKSPEFVVLRLTPRGATRPEDDVMLVYERTNAGVAFAWCDEVARNKADTVSFRTVAARAGVELQEVKEGGSTCLYGVGSSAKGLGPLVARQLYGMTDESELVLIEAKDSK
jgi:hypothetical protein